MKNLALLGKRYVLHKREEGREKVIFCPCGLKHVTKVKDERYLKCRCGKKVRLNGRYI